MDQCLDKIVGIVRPGTESFGWVLSPLVPGGNFGPEASVLTIPVVLGALLAMRAWSAPA